MKFQITGDSCKVFRKIGKFQCGRKIVSQGDFILEQSKCVYKKKEYIGISYSPQDANWQTYKTAK